MVMTRRYVPEPDGSYWNVAVYDDDPERRCWFVAITVHMAQAADLVAGMLGSVYSIGSRNLPLDVDAFAAALTATSYCTIAGIGALADLFVPYGGADPASLLEVILQALSDGLAARKRV